MDANSQTRNGGAAPEREHCSWVAAGQLVREQIHYVCEAAHGNDRQREMSFLRLLMRYDDTGEARRLEERIEITERHERSVRRAMLVMAVLFGLALTGLGYSVVLLDDFFRDSFQLIIRLFCALGLAAVVSLAVFFALGILARAALDEQRDGCRQLVARIVESRLGNPNDVSSARVRGASTQLKTDGLQAEERQPHDGRT